MPGAREKPIFGPIGVFKILIASMVLVACSSHVPLAPISDRKQPPSSKLYSHRVSVGETLYSIAWRYSIDYKTLARHNGISEDYTIYPGQLLRLDVHNAKRAAKPQKKPVNTASLPRRPQSTRAINKTVKSPSKKGSQIYSDQLRWRWPAKGKLLATFSSKNGLNKGIDIAGKLGEPVSSAGPGYVVYAGSGLRGYGKLLIIKHNEKFLSAYAHNRRLLVGEGDAVKAGQKIAEIGSSGTDRNKLHFEIRREGKPIDPLRYLPKR